MTARQMVAKRAVKCAKDLADVPPSAFRLPKDGKKWKSVCRVRREVLQRMALAANGNGCSVKVAVWPTIGKAVGISRASAFAIVGDLKTLEFVKDNELDPTYKTRCRQIDVAKVLASCALVQNSSAPVQNSGHPSRIAPDPTVFTEDLTENRKQGCAGAQALPISTSSGKSKSKPVRSSRGPIPPDSWDALLRHIQGPDFAEVEWRPIRRDRAALRSLWALVPEVEAICDALDAAVSHGATCAETLFSIATQLLERDYCGMRSQKAGTA